MLAVPVSLPADFDVRMRNLTKVLHEVLRNHYSQSPHTVVAAPAITSLPRHVAESLLSQMTELSMTSSTSISPTGTGMVVNFRLEASSESAEDTFMLHHRQVHANRSYPFVPAGGTARPPPADVQPPRNKRQRGPTGLAVVAAPAAH